METLPLPGNQQTEPTQNSQIKPSSGKNNLLAVLFFLLVIIIGLGTAYYFVYKPNLSLLTKQIVVPVSLSTPGSNFTLTGKEALKKFTSDTEFKAYIQKQLDTTEGFGNFGIEMSGPMLGIPTLDTGLKQALPPAGMGGGEARSSETNVQVKGIDEPDILKTDGQNIYFSSSQYQILPVRNGLILEDKMTPQVNSPEIKVLKAFPLADMAKKASIDKNGNMLLSDNNLVIFSNLIFGYDVKDPGNPNKKWEIDLGKNSTIVTSRLYKDKIYLITKLRNNFSNPCPIEPLTLNGNRFSIPCTDIYHPIIDTPADTTYTISIINPDSGKIENSVSLVGSDNGTQIYMSQNAAFITYSLSKNYNEITFDFYLNKGKDFLPADIIQKFTSLSKLDISIQAKTTEMQVIINKYQSTLDKDARMKFNNNTQNLLKAYSQENLREFTKTGIAKINISDLKIEASGTVPGSLLNQFSMDEYQDNLRVATTLGTGFWGNSESANDVYILDNNLKNIGSVVNLGLGERIYSVRFMDNTGYVVTFKQTDPFYVLDLSDPKNPEKKGELKIPGYSSYLDPIAQDRVLGIGKEGDQVKLSLFDVSSPSNPTEADKYTLDEYWSEILNTHHAFLLDSKHKVFFMPGGKGGYVFSFENDKLILKKAVEGNNIKRALYIDDYMYIVAENKLTVFDEKTWDTLKELTL